MHVKLGRSRVTLLLPRGRDLASTIVDPERPGDFNQVGDPKRSRPHVGRVNNQLSTIRTICRIDKETNTGSILPPGSAVDVRAMLQQ